jgi:hypothetical protein
MKGRSQSFKLLALPRENDDKIEVCIEVKVNEGVPEKVKVEPFIFIATDVLKSLIPFKLIP